MVLKTVFSGRAFGAGSFIGFPNNRIEPRVGCSKPAVSRSKVVFLQPEEQEG